MGKLGWQKVIRPLLKEGWGSTKSLIYLRPIDWILHGVMGEESESKGGFYLWLVRMPFYVPHDVIDLSWSERFMGGSTVIEEEEKLRRAVDQGMMLASKERVEATTVLLDPPGGADNGRMQEARAYGLVLEGKYVGALEILGRVTRRSVTYDWERRVLQRAEGMQSLLAEGRHSDVLEILKSWRLESIQSLGLEPG